MTEAETGKRPKPIELVARAIGFAMGAVDPDARACELTDDELRNVARVVFSILTKHGCISIEGIIARDEEMGTDVRKT